MRRPHPAMLVGLGSAAVAMGAPWWAFAALLAAGTLHAMVAAVFPQESAHRLAWWKALWGREEAP
jgi:hypothetical protein